MLNNKPNQPETYLSPEHRHFLFLKIFSSSLFIILFLATLIGSLYIYKNIFDALQSAKLALSNQGLPNIEVIDFDKLEKINKNWDEKLNNPSIDLSKNPFAHLPIPEKK